MSLILHLYYSGVGGSARRFAEEMERSGIADRIRAEEGNLRYEYYVPMKEPETVLLIDEWCDQAALDAHHGSPMMAQIAQLRDRYDLHMKIERMKTAEDAPAQDQSFIRE